MSDHVRKQIRDQLRTTLEGLGLRTFANRVAALGELELPAVTVLTEQETSERTSIDGVLKREIEVAIVVVFEGDTVSLDDELDGQASRIEAALAASPPAATRLFVLESTSLELLSDEEGESWYGLMSMVYRATTFTPKGDPTTIK